MRVDDLNIIFIFIILLKTLLNKHSIFNFIASLLLFVFVAQFVSYSMNLSLTSGNQFSLFDYENDVDNEEDEIEKDIDECLSDVSEIRFHNSFIFSSSIVYSRFFFISSNFKFCVFQPPKA